MYQILCIFCNILVYTCKGKAVEPFNKLNCSKIATIKLDVTSNEQYNHLQFMLC